MANCGLDDASYYCSNVIEGNRQENVTVQCKISRVNGNHSTGMQKTYTLLHHRYVCVFQVS